MSFPSQERLLERQSPELWSSEVRDVLWDMVEMVEYREGSHDNSHYHAMMVQDRYRECGPYVYRETSYVWNKVTNVLLDSRDGTVVGRMVKLDVGVEEGWVPLNLRGGRINIEGFKTGQLSESSDDEDDEGDADDEGDDEGDADDDLQCGRCGHPEQVIISRGFGWEDYLGVQDMGAGEELICLSCTVESPNDFYCIDCGYSEKLCKQYHGEQLGQFYNEGETRPFYQDENTRCHGCRSRVDRWGSAWLEEDSDDVDEDEGRVNRVLFPENDEEVLIGDQEELEETYVGELELAEENEENGEERSVRVKKTVQAMGEILFDIREKINEGEYLELMNGLQSITNEMNN